MYAYTGGKTGGHILPLLCLIEKSNTDSIYIGQSGNLEERLCREKNISFIGIKKYSSRIISAIRGYFFLKKALKKYKIDALISSGGYISLSACMYAIRNKIPIFLLEENVIMGNLNKMISPFCKRMFLAYDLKQKKPKYIVSGIPLRKKKSLTFTMKYDVLIIGGSLGSRVLCDLAEPISREYRVCLIAGRFKPDYKENPNLRVIEYSADIYALMAQSKVIVARAGASTSAEIFYLGRPYICIPSMKTKKNHQYYNAKYFSEGKACILCLENNARKQVLKDIHSLLHNEQMCLNMARAQENLVRADAAEKILSEIEECLK